MRQRVSCPNLADVRARWDGELDEQRAAEVQAHLAGCSQCQAEQRLLERVSAVLRTPDADEECAKEEHDRLKSALLERCAGSLAPNGHATPSRRSRRPSWRLLAVAAAGVAGALVLAGVLVQPRTAMYERAARPTAAPVDPIAAPARRANSYASGAAASTDSAGEVFARVVEREPVGASSNGARRQLHGSIATLVPLASVPPIRQQGDLEYGGAPPGGPVPAHILPEGRAPAARSLAHSQKIAYNPNAYLSSTYMGGTGSRDRIEKLIRDGVMVQGRRVRLEAFPRSYAQAFPIPTDTALSLIAGTERTKLVQEGGHTYLQVGLQAMQGEAPRRPPLNLALVIDCSGSMSDDHKLEFAKAAALRLVDRLRPGDVLALVAFDDQARLLVPAAKLRDRARVKAQIAALTPGSGTNIYEGLRLGHQQARRFASPETVNRVILLSDGEVTAGISDLRQFQKLVAAAVEHDVQTTTVGMGMEFNEELMLAVAREGKGNYHFLRDAADTQRVFARELEELTHVVAKAVRLRIRLADGVGLVRVLGAATLNGEQAQQVKAEEKRIDRKVAEELGIAANRQHEPDEPGLKLLIPSFYRGDHHVVMLELALPPGHGRRKVADVFLKYKDLARKANRTAESSVSIDYTSRHEEMIASIDRNIKKNLLGFQTGEALAEAAALIEQGRTAEAVRKIDERMVVLGVAAREWGDRDLDRDGQLLDRYKTVLAQLHRQPRLADGALGQYLRKSLTYAGYNLTR